MLGEDTIKQWPRERVESLRQYPTQDCAARGERISRSTIRRLLEHYGIQWHTRYSNKHGNAAWQELGR